ncbi:MAG: hypothetical protein AAFO91_19305, partial [Bacteroidota bacterium]
LMNVWGPAKKTMMRILQEYLDDSRTTRDDTVMLKLSLAEVDGSAAVTVQSSFALAEVLAWGTKLTQVEKALELIPAYMVTVLVEHYGFGGRPLNLTVQMFGVQPVYCERLVEINQ